jgi:hypothetical protein
MTGRASALPWPTFWSTNRLDLVDRHGCPGLKGLIRGYVVNAQRRNGPPDSRS